MVLLTSNVSAGDIKLCREQQVALQLRVDRACRRVLCEVAVYFRPFCRFNS